MITIADSPQAGDVQVGVAAEQRVVGPGDAVDALVAHHLPLGAFELETQPLVTVGRQDAQQVRAVFEARSVGGGINAGETEYETDQLGLFGRVERVHEFQLVQNRRLAGCIAGQLDLDGADHQPAVMDGCQQHMVWHDIPVGAGPDLVLDLFDSEHLLRCFKDM